MTDHQICKQSNSINITLVCLLCVWSMSYLMLLKGREFMHWGVVLGGGGVAVGGHQMFLGHFELLRRLRMTYS